MRRTAACLLLATLPTTLMANGPAIDYGPRPAYLIDKLSGGGWYFQTVSDVTTHDGVYFEVLDVLAQDVGVVGVFSDWPATTTYYANCMGL